jgi:hypothetical protein
VQRPRNQPWPPDCDEDEPEEGAGDCWLELEEGSTDSTAPTAMPAPVATAWVAAVAALDSAWPACWISRLALAGAFLAAALTFRAAVAVFRFIVGALAARRAAAWRVDAPLPAARLLLATREDLDLTDLPDLADFFVALVLAMVTPFRL